MKGNSFVGQAVDVIYCTENAEETKSVLDELAPKYDECATDVGNKYESAFLTRHSSGIDYKSTYCTHNRKPTIVKDRPFVPPAEVCLCNVVPEKEKVFKRPTKECVAETHTEIPCDTRIKTIVTGHYARTEVEAEANQYFGHEQTVEGVKKDRNYYVPQANVNPESSTQSIGYEDGTVQVDGSMVVHRG